MEKPILVCGIDLGGKTRKTTGVCLLKIVAGQPKFDRRRCNFCSVVQGEKLISYLKPYLSTIVVIAIDAPLTLGPGKGKMRLVVSKLASFGFELDKNLIETFPTFAKKVLKGLPKTSCRNQNERDAFVCALIAGHHLAEKTFWLGHRDGKLFLP